MSSPVDIARESWGTDLPDWVEILATECAATSQNKVAKRMGRSAALVSAVLRGKYAGDLDAVEEIVRGIFQAATVDCPALGEVPSNECAEWRRRSRQFVSANARRVMMFRACNACPRNRKEGEV